MEPFRSIPDPIADCSDQPLTERQQRNLLILGAMGTRGARRGGSLVH